MTLLPPPVYDHPPVIPVIEHVLPLDEVDKECVAIAAAKGMVRPMRLRFRGCSIVVGDPREGEHFGQDVCLVYRIADDDVRRHEFAHCNGWRHPFEWAKIEPAVKPPTAPITVLKVRPAWAPSEWLNGVSGLKPWPVGDTSTEAP